MVYNEKRKVELEVDDLADILPGKENVRIRVRIVRLWKVPSFVNPSQSISLEMVLVDEKVIIIILKWLFVIVYIQICVVTGVLEYCIMCY
jgi:hypothetical protein